MMDCVGAMGSMGMGPGGTMWLFWLLLVGLVVWGLYQLFTMKDSARSPRETPLEALRRRYATGDLSTEEYEERKRVLGR